jgi:hypothetical protein
MNGISGSSVQGSAARKLAIGLALAGVFGAAVLSPVASHAQETAQGTAAPAAASKVGTVKSISGTTIVLKVDSGADVTIAVPEGARVLRLAPGQTSLKSATPMTLPEVQVGDRMLVRGKPGDNPDSFVASSVVVMKQADVAQKQQTERDDWQKRGTGGIVSAIDMAGGAITVAVTPTLNVEVKTSKDTGFLRYAPTSIKFADAQKGSFDQIKVGDQLRARGTRSADGKEIAAEEVISGTFRNIAGTITAIDSASGSITIKDILAKKSVVVKISPDSQMRKLAPQMAQRLAFFLKGSAGGAQGGTPASGQPAPSGTAGANNAGGTPGAGGPRPAGPPDFQQMLSRIPNVTLAELQKEDAVMVVSTQDNGTGVMAITLLAGVEPILTASPNGAAALFSGWNLGTPGGEGGPQ